jgi:hypothetical protein
MAAGAGFMLKNNPQSAVATVGMPSGGMDVPAGPGALLTSLKEELFAVETDRLEGRLGEAEYAEQKAALEIVLKRALSRRERAGTSNTQETKPLRG